MIWWLRSGPPAPWGEEGALGGGVLCVCMRAGFKSSVHERNGGPGQLTQKGRSTLGGGGCMQVTGSVRTDGCGGTDVYYKQDV